MFGPNPWSAALALALVGLQLGGAWLLRESSPWLVLVAAYACGAFVAASLYALIHDAVHGLIFRGRAANRAMAIAANTALGSLAAEPFGRYHQAHHRFTGDYARDVGIPTLAEARWVGRSPWRKAVWLAGFSFFQLMRTGKAGDSRRFWCRWMVANVVWVVLVDLVVLATCGVAGLAYLLLSVLFAFGFHPLGARVIQEHVLLHPTQETANYTGAANWLECNFGCHNEHHDFPCVPWNRLPALRRLAPEAYRELGEHRSRWRLIVRFVLDPEWHLFRHAVRNPPPA